MRNSSFPGTLIEDLNRKLNYIQIILLPKNITDISRRTIAQNFSLTLNELFKIENCISDLDAAVYEKYFFYPPSNRLVQRVC